MIFRYWILIVHAFRRTLLFILLLLVPVAEQVYPDGASGQVVRRDESLASQELENRAQALMHEIVCQVCAGQSVLESAAPLAADLRAFVRNRVVQGQSDAAILEELSASYGNVILMRPTFGPETLVLWFGPLIVALLGFLLARRFRSRKSR